MRLRLLLPGCALAVCLIYPSKSNAQTNPDSTYFDLGRVKLQKNFTQNVTIKGADLLRFPFTNLSEAVNVWFSGNFTSQTNLVYVVDGQVILDANQYPVQNIEEITLVQNAVGFVNGISQQQQLVLVKTKRNLIQSSGIEVSGQANLVQIQNRGIFKNTPNTQRETKLFQQYNLSAFKNFNKVHLGISANYQHDVIPVKTLGNVQVLTPPNLDRWRLNGYLNAEVWEGSTLDINIGYTPQTRDEHTIGSNTSTRSDITNTINEKQFNTSLSLLSTIVPGLTNHFKAGYVRSKNTTDNVGSQTLNNVTSNYANQYNYKWDNLLISDELRYTHEADDFTISPAVNFSYRYLYNFNDYVNNWIGQTVFAGTSNTKLKTSLLTPSLGISYKNLINVTGGLLYIIKADPTPNVDGYKKTFPFVTATIDAAHLISEDSPVSAKAYGSFALSNQYNDYHYNLDNMAAQPDYILNTMSPVSNIPTINVSEKNFKTFTLGTDIGLFENKLTVSYNYEKRKYFNYFLGSYYSPYSSSYSPNILTENKTTSHRISVGFNMVSQHSFKWQTILNTTTSKYDINLPLMYPYTLNGKDIWTGGFTNRLQYKNWVGGLDMLYLFGKNNIANAQIQNLRSFSLQNAYVGYNIKTSKLKGLEVYANGRNLLQNDKSVFTNYSRYFGLGFKAGI